MRLREFASESVARALEDAELRSKLGASNDAAVSLLHDSLRAREERHALAARRLRCWARVAPVSSRRSKTSWCPTQLSAQRLEVIETVGDPAIVRPLLALGVARERRLRR